MKGFELIYKEFQLFDWSNTRRICAEKCRRDSPAVLYGLLSPAVMVTRGQRSHRAFLFSLFSLNIYTGVSHSAKQHTKTILSHESCSLYFDNADRTRSHIVPVNNIGCGMKT